ncbi:MAG: hypothetical protein H7Z17_21540 [Fuerstia sp.]|nr:hypothetical protein [Fuerstiella sp.]
MSFTNEMHYAAFRAAFVLTLDCMLREALNRQNPVARPGGFLDVYPVLLGTAPQIQLECLLRTWDHLQHGDTPLTPFDHGVINAAFEALAKMGELSTRPTLSSVWKGPKSISTACDHWVTSKVRALQLALDETTSSELVRLERRLDDRNPVSAASPGYGIPGSSDEISAIVGRWRAAGDIVLGSKGLLSDEEQDILRIFFEEQSGLLR